jgi:hypothetical protein
MKSKLTLIAIASSFLLVGGCSKDAATPTVPKPSSKQTQTYDPATDTTTVSKDGNTWFVKGDLANPTNGFQRSFTANPTNGTAVKQTTP